MTSLPATVQRPEPIRWLVVPPGPDRTASTRVGGWLLAVAVLVDVLRPGAASIAVGLVAMVVVTVLTGLGLLHDRGLVPACLAVTFACAAGVRASPWLVPLDLLAAAGLLVWAASLARGGRLTDLGPDQLAQRGLRLARSTICGPAWVAGPLHARARRAGGRHTARALPVVRGVLLAAPVVVALGLLLGSSDAVFASLFDLDVDLPDVADHVVVIALVWLAGCALATDAASPPIVRREAVPRLLGQVEAAVVLAGLVVLFALFAAAQVVTLAGGAAHVLETAGLTRAQYARSGFFQLLAVAALTLATLTVVRSTVRSGAPRADRLVRTLTLAAVALTQVVVVVAITRLALYVDAYGLSMLRLCTMLVAGWIGVVFAGFGAAVAGVGAPRRWLVPFAAASGLAALLVLHVVNAEALVVRHNLTHWERTGRLDVAYLTTDLSEDAMPALLAGSERLDPPRRARVRTAVCARRVGDPDAPSWAWNWSRERAAAAIAAACHAG